MCCFTQAVDRVSDTRIFARGMNGRQVIVYSMAYAARSDLAMVLPLPVPPRPPEDAVRFINLAGYPQFFVDMETAFVHAVLLEREMGRLELYSPPVPLVVHEVGAFEASFVPTLGDFERLDPRFRIPQTVWDQLPAYRDYGFGVFKLKASTRRWFGSSKAEARKVHPMAFEFPRRQPELLYFPTLHVHDGTVHPGADFDHVLYCQPEPGWDHTVHLRNWSWSRGAASRFLDASKAQGLVSPEEHLFRFRLDGRRQNRDTWVSINSSYPDLVPS